MKESKHSLEKLWYKQGLLWDFLKPGRRLGNFQHTRPWQNQRRRKPIEENGVQGYTKVPDEVETWVAKPSLEMMVSYANISVQKLRVHILHIVSCYIYQLLLPSQYGIKFSWKKLDISSQCSTMVYEPMPCSCHALYSFCWSAYWQWVREQCMTSLTVWENIYSFAPNYLLVGEKAVRKWLDLYSYRWKNQGCGKHSWLFFWVPITLVDMNFVPPPSANS